MLGHKSAARQSTRTRIIFDDDLNAVAPALDKAGKQALKRAKKAAKNHKGGQHVAIGTIHRGRTASQITIGSELRE